MADTFSLLKTAHDVGLNEPSHLGFYILNFFYRGTIMKKLSKALSVVLGMVLGLGFFSCQTGTTLPDPTMYTVSISSSIEHGKVTADKSSAEAGVTVKLTATADSGYELESYSVKDASANTITVTDGTFTMPKSNVTVSATFKETAATPQKTAGSISYATTAVEKTTYDEAFTNELTKTGDGTVSYTSSKEAVAMVDASTGEVTIVGAGETTITATVTDSDTYTYATKTVSYTLTVTSVVTIPEGFVKVTGTTITGNETLSPVSNVFVSGRSLDIPDLIVCDHEVTQKEYTTYCKFGGTQPSSNIVDCGIGDNYPAYLVNWYDAVVYCNLRTIAELGIESCVYSIDGEKDPRKWSGIGGDADSKYCGPDSENTTWDSMAADFKATGYRLPTEAEWEYIARGANSSSYIYSGDSSIGWVAWYKDNSDNKSHKVKTKPKANSLGIYDMSGNVFEFCWDWFGSISPSTEATGSATGTNRVIRGGSFTSWNNEECTVSYRESQTPSARYVICGFRVVRNAL